MRVFPGKHFLLPPGHSRRVFSSRRILAIFEQSSLDRVPFIALLEDSRHVFSESACYLVAGQSACNPGVSRSGRMLPVCIWLGGPCATRLLIMLSKSPRTNRGFACHGRKEKALGQGRHVRRRLTRCTVAFTSKLGWAHLETVKPLSAYWNSKTPRVGTAVARRLLDEPSNGSRTEQARPKRPARDHRGPCRRAPLEPRTRNQ